MWLAVLVLSRAFVDYSTSGLENPLTHLLLAGFVLALDRAKDRRGVLAPALWGGLAVLNRMDALLLVAPALLLLLWRHRSRRATGSLAVGFLPFLIWELFATFNYGFPYPNTAPAKLSTGIPSGELLFQGFRYLENSLRTDPLTLGVTAAGVVAALARRRALETCLALGILLYLAYLVKVGSDFMSGRHLSAPLLLAILLLARSELLRSRRRELAVTAAVVLTGFLAPYPTLLSRSDFGLKRDELIDVHGIADERRYYFAYSGLWNGVNGPRPGGPSAYLGRELHRSRAAIAVEGAIGFLGVEAGPGVHVVAYHGLGDPLLARLPAVKSDPLYRSFLRNMAGKEPERAWRVGHYLRVIPRGYLATLLTGENQMEHPLTAELYNRLRLVTRGTLWSRERLLEILRLNLGGASRAPAARPDYEPPLWSEVLAARPDQAEAWFRLGESRFKDEDFEAAARAFERAVEVDPGHALARINLVVSEGRLGRTERAREHLAYLESLDPKLGAAHLMIGRLWKLLDEKERALRSLEKAVRLDPTQVEASQLARERHEEPAAHD